MRRLRVSILDLVTKGPTRALWGRAMQPYFASIMPQALGVWCEYFDYILGFTDQALVRDVLRDCAHHHPGVHLSARSQPSHLPGVRERWKFIAPTLAKTPVIKLIPSTT